MKGKITRNIECMYYGEVLTETGWKKVTPPCLAKIGAMMELKRWKMNTSDLNYVKSLPFREALSS